MGFPRFVGAMGDVVNALRNQVDNSISELEIFWGLDEATETLDNVLAFNKLIADYPLKSLVIGHRCPIEATRDSPLYWLMNGVIRYVSKSNTLECLDLRFVEIGHDILDFLNNALMCNSALKTILLSDKDKSIVSNSKTTQFENIQNRLSDAKNRQELNTDLPKFPNIFSRAAVNEPRQESSALKSLVSGFLGVLKACVNPFIKHPILTALCIAFAVAAIIVICIPGVGQAIGVAGATAFAAKGITSGLSAAFTALAATKAGAFLGLIVPSIPALAIAAKAILATTCGLVAGSLPLVGKGILSLISKGFELAKSLCSTENTTELLPLLDLEDAPDSGPAVGTSAPLPAATPAKPFVFGTALVVQAALAADSKQNGKAGETGAATGTAVGSTVPDKHLSRPKYPALHDVNISLLPGEFSEVFTPAAPPAAPTPYIQAVAVPSVVPATPVLVQQDDLKGRQYDLDAGGTGLSLDND
jgi:hypothetical protein